MQPSPPLSITATADRSPAALFAELPADVQAAILAELDQLTLQAIAERRCYRWFARGKQLPPRGDWGTWIVRAGRGFGKTFTGAGWVHERAMQEKRWIAVIGKTPADARDYQIEGPAGILKVAPAHEAPEYRPSMRRIEWPNGSWATIYSSEEPDQLRGFSGDTAWIDELAKFRNPADVWKMLGFGMREASSDRPRRLITTTPRPLRLLQEVEQLPSTVVVIGHSEENRGNLDESWYLETIEPLKGTRLYRQEVAAEILTDVPGSLFPREMLDRLRVREVPELVDVVVGVDPSGSSGEGAARCGIVIAGKGEDGHGYILGDWSLRGTPDEWARRVVQAYRSFKANRVVVERNFGGEMCQAVIRNADPGIPVRMVTATRGKVIRAEPVAQLFERGLVHPAADGLEQLEDELALFVPGERLDPSPDRGDACIWALTALLVHNVEFRVRTFGEGSSTSSRRAAENGYTVRRLEPSKPDPDNVIFYGHDGPRKIPRSVFR